MKLSVLKENQKNETRVALAPSSVKDLIKFGFEVFIQIDAGLSSGYTNKEYEDFADDRNKTDVIISSGLPNLPIGIFLQNSL